MYLIEDGKTNAEIGVEISVIPKEKMDENDNTRIAEVKAEKEARIAETRSIVEQLIKEENPKENAAGAAGVPAGELEGEPAVKAEVPLPIWQEVPAEEKTNNNDFCNIKFKFRAGSKVITIISLISQMELILHDAGHSLNNRCYECRFNITYEGVPEDVKKKLTNIDWRKMQTFFGITAEYPKKGNILEVLNDKEAIDNIIKGILNCI
jgi:hypothetical protein